MGFKTLVPIAKAQRAPVDGLCVSASQQRKVEGSPLVVNVTIGAELFEEFGSPDRVSAALGEGPDAGKLQLKAQHPESTAVGFAVRVLKAGAASVRIGVPGIRRAARASVVEHDLNDDDLTFIIPPDLFRPLPSTHAAEEARAGRGGVNSKTLH